MNLQEQIRRAVGSHGLWKTRLRTAIDTGKSDVTTTTARDDRRCELGRWLQELDAEARKAASCQRCQGLHREFHQEAANVLSLALEGKKQEAKKSLEAGHFAKLSAELTRAMMAWMGQA